MSQFHRILFRCLVLLTACLASSCIDIKEEVWLKPNGSGEAEISCWLPAAAANLQGGEAGIRAKLEKFLTATPSLRSLSYEVSTADERIHIRCKVGFDSAHELKEISGGDSLKKLPAAVAGLAGKVSMKLRGLTLDFNREISASAALPGSFFMPKSQFENHQLTYIIHLPNAAKTSNASQIEDSGRTLIWNFPLTEALKAPVTTRFSIEIPIPRSWLIGAALALVLLLCGLYYGVSKLRKKRAAAG
jgi:hypothetical protein